MTYSKPELLATASALESICGNKGIPVSFDDVDLTDTAAYEIDE